MIIHFDPAFRRRYDKLPQSQKDRVNAALELFLHHPFHPQLHNHKLSGSMRGLRSISGGYDLRMLYEEKDGHHLVLMLKVGTHDEVY